MLKVTDVKVSMASFSGILTITNTVQNAMATWNQHFSVATAMVRIITTYYFNYCAVR